MKTNAFACVPVETRASSKSEPVNNLILFINFEAILVLQIIRLRLIVVTKPKKEKTKIKKQKV